MRAVISSIGLLGGENFDAESTESFTRLAYARPWSPWDEVLMVDPGEDARRGVDVRTLRVMDKQSLHLMLAAQSCLRTCADHQGVAPHRRGVFAAIPSVDDHIPSAQAIDEIRRHGHSEGDLLDFGLLANSTHPLVGLTCLNSTAAAHVSIKLQAQGSMGVYCQGGDAGLSAVIDAAISVAEGDNDLAYAMGVAPKISPYLFLHLEKAGYFREGSGHPRLAEGAACLALARDTGNRSPGAFVAGFARGFCTRSGDFQARRAELMRSALDNAGIQAASLLDVWADPICGGRGESAERAAIGDFLGATESCEDAVIHSPRVHAGAAGGLFAIARAVEILARRWEIGDGGQGACLAVVNASGIAGQMASVVVGYGA